MTLEWEDVCGGIALTLDFAAPRTGINTFLLFYKPPPVMPPGLKDLLQQPEGTETHSHPEPPLPVGGSGLSYLQGSGVCPALDGALAQAGEGQAAAAWACTALPLASLLQNSPSACKGWTLSLPVTRLEGRTEGLVETRPLETEVWGPTWWWRSEGPPLPEAAAGVGGWVYLTHAHLVAQIAMFLRSPGQTQRHPVPASLRESLEGEAER